jgi:predicted permease
MDWSKVGGWIKDNGLPIVGSLLTGGTTAAIATGVSLLQSATGETEPDKVMASLKNNPEAMIRLKELTVKDDDNIRQHLAKMEELKLTDKQLEHEQTQLTIRNGDQLNGKKAWVRPTHSTISLVFAMFYAYNNPNIDVYVLGLFLALPFTYGGLRTFDKLGFNPLKR